MDRLIALVVLRFKSDLRALLRARERVLGLLILVPGMMLFSVLWAFVAYFGISAIERAQPAAVLPLLSALVTAFGVLWALAPLLSGVALTESHDVARLLHFPVPLATLVASSLVANLLQPTLLAQLPLVVGVALATAGGARAFLPALVAVELSFLLVLAVAQAVGLALHGLARNRRLHDAALFFGLGLGVALSIVPLLFLASGRIALGAARWLVETDPFVLSPFAWGVRAAVYAGRGELAAFLVFTTLALVAIATAVALTAALMRAIYRGELRVGPAFGPGAARVARMRLPGAVGALVEKDLRVAWRDPALKALLVTGLVGPLLLLLLVLTRAPTGPGSGKLLLLLATFVGLGAFGSNAFGFERRGLLLLLAFPVDRFSILVGKNLASLTLRLPGALLLLLAGLVIAPLSVLPAAATVAVATLLIAAAFDNYLSILFPATVPAAGANPYGGPAAGGRGLGSLALTLTLLPAVLIVSGPFAFLAWLPLWFEAPLLWWATLPLALAGAAAVYALLTAGAARLLERRETWLLERVLGEA